MDKKILKTMIYVSAGFIIFILLIFIISSCSKKQYTPQNLEDKIVDVAKLYYQDNKNKLPLNDKDSIVLTINQMVKEGYLDSLDKLMGEDIKCNGNVTVTNNNNYYLYSPQVNCGKVYHSVLLADKLKENVVTKGVGLYSVNNQYIYKGEVDNNYLSLNNKLFRIIRINEDNTIRLIEVDGLKNVIWDDRYNSETNYSSGINDFITNSIDSRIRETLKNYYNDSTIWTDDIKAYISTQTLCIGKRNVLDQGKDGAIECSQKLDNQTLGLLATYEFLQASLEDECKYTKDKTCENYNWLGKNDIYTWLVTATSEDSRYAYMLYKNLDINNCSSQANMLSVFNISDKVLYSSGDGTLNNPYIIK